MLALAGTASLLFTLHPCLDMFRVWRRLSGRRLMCYNARRGEFLADDIGRVGVGGACFVVLMRRGGAGQGRLKQLRFSGCADARACREGGSPVSIACLMGHLSCVEALIRLKADVLQCDRYVFVRDDRGLMLVGRVVLMLGCVDGGRGNAGWGRGK
jgi:hypothetical protein